ncbi:MAG: hypothetical protein ACP5KS_01110 [Candidatus Hydrogenedens sp.]
MKETNNPDVALAWEWIEELDAWLGKNGLCGYDRFNVKDHPLCRSLQTMPLLRKLSSGYSELFPKFTRWLLRVKKTENPKAHALMATGHLRLLSIEPEKEHLERAERHLLWLRSQRVPGLDGWAWGYPFAYTGKGVHVPANTPVSVVTAIAGQAFLSAYQMTQEEQYLSAILEIAEFFIKELPHWKLKNGGLCFGYALKGDPRKVHNANLLVAEYLYHVSHITGEKKYQEIAEPALEFSLNAQNENGSWYYGYWEEDDPSEKELHKIIDNHHTGFVLRSLYGIYKLEPNEVLKEKILKGFQYYATLFEECGQPYFAENKKWPVDIHACAEGILCPSILAEVIPAAHVLAVFVLRWAWFHMRNLKTGELYYRRYPFFISKITFPRWGVALMFRAIAEYLSRFYEVKERVERLKMQAIRWIEPIPNIGNTSNSNTIEETK